MTEVSNFKESEKMEIAQKTRCRISVSGMLKFHTWHIMHGYTMCFPMWKGIIISATVKKIDFISTKV